MRGCLQWHVDRSTGAANYIVASSPQQQQLRQALEREDLFMVSIDLFATDTTDYADIVLPAASFLEFDDLVFSYFNYSISAQAKATEPMGEALPNQEIFRRLAAEMYKGRWPKLDSSSANVNILNPGRKTDLAESSCVHSIEVEIKPAVVTD